MIRAPRPRFLAGLALAAALAAAAAAPRLLAQQAPAAAKPLYTNAIVAAVNDELITLQDVDAQIRPQTIRELARQYQGEALERQLQELRRKVVRTLVENELLYADFKAKGYKVPQELVQRRLDSILVAEAGGNREQFEKSLFERGQTFPEFEEKVRKLVAVDLLVDELIRRPVRISPKEVQAYYDAHATEFAKPRRLRLAMLFLKTDGKHAGDLAAIRAQIGKLLAEKADFAWLVKQFSEGPNPEAGGDLGWVTPGDLQPEMAAAVASLAQGQVSGPVQGKDGIAFLKVVEQEAAAAATLTPELAQRIENRLKLEQEKRRFEEYLGQIRPDHRVQIFE
ncbi:MAG: peptidylprolyl isomerase [Lentisphaeria bacterium]|jgi:parvulin-like peptidyl-prolyl isomerase